MVRTSLTCSCVCRGGRLVVRPSKERTGQLAKAAGVSQDPAAGLSFQPQPCQALRSTTSHLSSIEISRRQHTALLTLPTIQISQLYLQNPPPVGHIFLGRLPVFLLWVAFVEPLGINAVRKQEDHSLTTSVGALRCYLFCFAYYTYPQSQILPGSVLDLLIIKKLFYSPFC